MQKSSVVGKGKENMVRWQERKAGARFVVKAWCVERDLLRRSGKPNTSLPLKREGAA